eukprot:361420-Chlamydomonas_euryale.AAC.3
MHVCVRRTNVGAARAPMRAAPTTAAAAVPTRGSPAAAAPSTATASSARSIPAAPTTLTEIPTRVMRCLALRTAVESPAAVGATPGQLLPAAAVARADCLRSAFQRL